MALRLVVVGTGAAARLHIKAAQSLSSIHLLGIVGRDEVKAKAIANEYALDCVWSDVIQIWRDDRIDGVILAAPPAELAGLAVAAFAAGKHVLCEKPLGIGVAQAESVVAAWQHSGCIGMVNFCYRFHPALIEFKRRLMMNTCGELTVIKLDWALPTRLNQNLTYHWKGQEELGGGVLQNFGVHILDFLFADQRNVKLLSANQRIFTPQRLDSKGQSRKITGDEVTTALFLWNECVVVIHLSLVTKAGSGLRINAQGSAGSLEVSEILQKNHASKWKIDFHKEQLGSDSEEIYFSDNTILLNMFYETQKMFSNAIGSGNIHLCPTLNYGLRAAHWIQEIQSRATEMRM
jgi:predicted dehydrogenase